MHLETVVLYTLKGFKANLLPRAG